MRTRRWWGTLDCPAQGGAGRRRRTRGRSSVNTHRVLLAGVAAMACLAPVSIAASNLASKPAKKHREFYVALGDSLSRGAQPNTSGETVLTHQGYADDIYA